MVNNINDLAGIVTVILSELSLLTKEIDGNGIISKRLILEKVKNRGSWEDVLKGVNNIVDALVLPINTLSSVLGDLGNGIIPSKIIREKQGDLLKIKNAANDTIDNFSDLQKAGAYLKNLAVNDFSKTFEVSYKGIFADLKDSINEVRNSFLSIQDITTNIANGNLSDIDSLKSVGTKSENDKLIPSFIYMMESISNLIVEAKLLSDSAENGDLDFRADGSKHKGKYKEIINGANRIKDNLVSPLKRVMKFINNTAKGKVDPKWDVDVKGDYKVLYQNVNILKDGLVNILEEIRLATKAAADGNLSNRIDISKVDGDWRNLLSGINSIIDNLLEPVNEAVSVIEKMAIGDLSSRMVGDYKGDDAILKDSLNIALDNLVNILQTFDVTIEQVNGGADQVSDASQSLSQGATEQAASLEEVSSSMQEIGAQSKHNAENAVVASNLSIDARKNASDGNLKMNELDRAMKGINESSNKIKKVIKVIDDIAFQTNLLAINAAVEAARAGVHGKGFAVVASEVRNLAQKSAKAAEETTGLIEGSIKEIEIGNNLSDKTAEFLRTIVEGITKVTDIVEEINAASDEQNRSISQSIDAIEQVSIVTQQNAAASEETASASVELTGQSNELKKMIAKFKLSDEDNSVFGTQDMVLERREEPQVVREEVPALEYADDDFGEF